MAKQTFERHSLTLQSGLGAPDEGSAWARSLAEAAGWPEERTYALDLCIVEMVSNVVDHCYRGSPGEITLELEIGQRFDSFDVTLQRTAGARTSPGRTPEATTTSAIWAKSRSLRRSKRSARVPPYTLNRKMGR